MRDPFRRPLTWLSACLAFFQLASAGVRADTVAEDTLKAGFVLNFAKYTEWPANAAGQNGLLVCGIGADSLSGKLASLQGRLAQGREIQVRAPTRASEWSDCHVLFIAAEELQRANAGLGNLQHLPVLTVSDAPGFAQAGGIIGLKLRAGRVRFDVNQGAARGAGLKLSSQVLKLADEVLQ